jgi:hypothetical protein
VPAGEAKAVLLLRTDLEKASFHFSAAMKAGVSTKKAIGGPMMGKG